MKELGAAVYIAGLRKHYGDVRAVDGINLMIAPGEVVALLGPNGAGKSTTVDMLIGLTRPDAGEVKVFGNEPDRAVAEGSIGAMLQNGTLLDDATVVETAALVSNPDLLVLDEPTAAMDVATRREFWASMREFTNAGRTVVFATHYLDEAEEFADRVVLMRSGQIAADGTVATVREMASGRTISAVLANVQVDELNRLPGVVDATRRAERIQLASADSDVTLRALLAGYPDVHDIEISAAGLEETFLALTAKENA